MEMMFVEGMRVRWVGRDELGVGEVAEVVLHGSAVRVNWPDVGYGLIVAMGNLRSVTTCGFVGCELETANTIVCTNCYRAPAERPN